MLNVGVSAGGINRVTAGVGGPRQLAVVTFVSHMVMVMGNVALPTSADTVIMPVTPTFVVATAKAPMPVLAGTLTMPSFSSVAASAMMSGTGLEDAVRFSVFNPTTVGARSVFVQLKPNWISVGLISSVGVSEITKVCVVPPGIFTGVFGVPIGRFVAGSVAWNVKGVGTPVSCVIPHLAPSTPRATVAGAKGSTLKRPPLVMLANTVAPVPTVTDRLVGRIALTNGGGGRHSASKRLPNENMPASLPAWIQLPAGFTTSALTPDVIVPALWGTQLVPASVLRYTPPAEAPAKSVSGVRASIASVRISWSARPLSFQVAPP